MKSKLLFDVPQYKKLRVIIDTDAACEADAPFAIAVDDVTVTAVDGDGNPNDPGFVGYIMLPPPAVSNVTNFKYTLAVKVNYDKGEGLTTKTLEYELNSDDGFKAGQIYNIVVTVNPEP